MPHDYGMLEDELRDRGLLNEDDSTIFDLEEDNVGKVYDKLLDDDKIEPNMTRQQKVSKKDIVNAVDEHVEQYGDNTLFVYRGDAKRIWSAVDELEEEHGFKYLSTTPRSITIEDIQERSILPPREDKRSALAGLVSEMSKAMSVLKEQGYDEIRDFVGQRDETGENVAVGIEETEISELYTEGEREAIYDALKEKIEEEEIDSVLYIQENLSFDSAKRSLKRGDKNPRNDFLQYANAQGLDVGVVEMSIGNYGDIPDEVRQQRKMKRMAEKQQQAMQQDQPYPTD